jgi:signal transduction histidine kinase
MKRSADGPYQWIFYLTAAFLFGGYALRALLVYRDNPALSQVLELLAAWLGLFASETTISRRWSGYFPIYLVLQTILVVVLLSLPGSPDYFAVLFAILGMQVMQRFAPRLGAVWIGLWALLMALALAESYGVARAIAFALIYTFMNVFLAFYALTTRRAQTARARNQALAQELQEANRQLQATSTQLERLAVARERQRLARELHDSVTQTIFSMTLTTQSALLLLDRDPSRVGAQLDCGRRSQ